jgi:mRNA interferase MazF
LKRGDLYRIYKGSKRPSKSYRVFAVVSRQALIDSKFSTVMCAPVYSNYHGISTQVPVGIDEGVKHEGCIYCDEVIGIPKKLLTEYIGTLSDSKLLELNKALSIALELD